jgi:surface polysaccharide O-acyltransferase-like enzyme
VRYFVHSLLHMHLKTNSKLLLTCSYLSLLEMFKTRSRMHNAYIYIYIFVCVCVCVCVFHCGLLLQNKIYHLKNINRCIAMLSFRSRIIHMHQRCRWLGQSMLVLMHIQNCVRLKKRVALQSFGHEGIE